MNTTLFLLCPTDCLESIINKEYKGNNYFYTSLVNIFTYNSTTYESIKGLVYKHHIKKIYFILSDQNKIVEDALEGQIYSEVRGLQNFNERIKFHKEQAELFCKTTEPMFLALSYYLNQKIRQLHLICQSDHSICIKGKVYLKHKNTFVDIYPDLVCLKAHNLN